jgi:hypothetical protein
MNTHYRPSDFRSVRSWKSSPDDPWPRSATASAYVIRLTVLVSGIALLVGLVVRRWL